MSPLSKADTDRRHQWVEERRGWTAENFEGVVWSGECILETFKDSRQT